MTMNTTRRAALGAIASTAIAGTVHASDCATNNAPALEPGECNCGAQHPDATLLALDKQLDALLIEFDEHDAMPEDFNHPIWQQLIAEHPYEHDICGWHHGQILARYHEVIDAIMDEQPRTPEGLAVMARTLSLEWDKMEEDMDGREEVFCRAVLAFCGAEPRDYVWT
jgi:hypothetical protein